MVIGDNEITDPFEVCNAFNKHFTNIGPSLVLKVNTPRVSFRDFITPCNSSRFDLVLINAQEVLKLVGDLPAWKAAGLLRQEPCWYSSLSSQGINFIYSRLL